MVKRNAEVKGIDIINAAIEAEALLSEQGVKMSEVRMTMEQYLLVAKALNHPTLNNSAKDPMINSVIIVITNNEDGLKELK